MKTNFDFLKRVDKNLFTIITEAELLYRDEYFEQCMVQTRRFGEYICKSVLGNRRRAERTFDDMLATLKDKITGEEQEKEFIDDLYFLKKHGNSSAHSVKVHKDGIEALECLQRAFEIAINYCVYYKKTDSKIIELQYDTELLITGKKSKKTLAEKYKEEKAKGTTRGNNRNAYTSKKIVQKDKPQSYKMNTKKEKTGLSTFWIFVVVSLLFSIIILIFMSLL